MVHPRESFLDDLGALGDPLALRDPMDLTSADPEVLIRMLRAMLLIRRTEESVGDGVERGDVRCPAHLAIGQEAIAVGVSAHLRPTDRVFGAHRSHSHYLALGGDVYRLIAEILGKDDGCSKGMGGSMHVWAADRGLYGTVPIVAGTVPLAVGAALAAQKDGRGDVAVAYFGDGASEEGAVHESLNLASAWRLPVLFVCENNLFSSHLHISERQPASRIARLADAHRILNETVDGNDVLAVARAAERLIGRSRRGEGPGFLEAVTYRWRGHVGHREDDDVGVNRGPDLASWKHHDPIRRLADALIASELVAEATLAEVETQLTHYIADAWRRAREAPYPVASALLDRVYAAGTA